MKSLAQFLLGQTRASVLSTLLLRPEAALHVRELARLTGASAGSLHRDLRALAQLGLLIRTEVGRQVHYRANTASPIYEELAGLLRKTAGLVDVLREALMPVADRIESAFVYGSMADGRAHAHSDVDLMIVGEIGFGDAVQALVPASQALRREVNPTVLTAVQVRKKQRQGDSFVSSIWRGPRLWVIGQQEGDGA